MMPFRPCLVLIVSMIASLAVSAPQGFGIVVSPLFQGSQVSTGFVPLKAAVSNSGPDAVGRLTVRVGTYVMSYPVELPHDSEKELVVYTLAGSDSTFGTSLQLDTNQGSASKPVHPAGMTASDGDLVLEIGGHSGDLGFLSSSSETNPASPHAGAAYVSPEDAPDRLEAYSGCSMIVLSKGAERLSDGAVKALWLYVQNGGVLAFPGGTISPILSDGRWHGLFPARPRPPRLFNGDHVLGLYSGRSGITQKFGSGRIAFPYAVIPSDPEPGAQVSAENGVNLITAKQFGLGTVVFWAFDPFGPVVKDWNGRAGFVLHSAHSPVNEQAGKMSTEPATESSQRRFPGMGPSPAFRFEPEDTGVFRVTMPSAARVGTILAVYLICVVPLNFYVLQRIGKRQWGWVTGALISALFSVVMLAQAKDLYGLKTSHSDTVVAVGQKGSKLTIAKGRSQIFASSSGIFDLKLAGVDSVAPVDPDYGDNRRQQGLQSFAPDDTGEVSIRAAKFSNLNFSEMRFVQLLESRDPVTILRTASGYRVISHTHLKKAVLVRIGGVVELGDLADGSEKSVSSEKFGQPPQDSEANLLTGLQSGNPSAKTDVTSTVTRLEAHAGDWLWEGRYAVVAAAPDLQVGPKIGNKLAPDPVLIYFSDGLP